MKQWFEHVKKIWARTSKTVMLSMWLVLLMLVVAVLGSLTVTGAIVFGTTAIVFAVLSLRE